MGRRVETIREDVGAGETIVADISGSGEPVLFVHGIPGSRASWRRVAERLEGGAQAIVPDLLGFGDSSDPRSDFHAFGQARALGRLMDVLGHDSFHVAGHDFGGPTAIALSGLRTHLPPRQAAALLLREVHGFSAAEAAETLEATPTQVKNWIQQARRAMTERYAYSCALVAKAGVCYQCVELDDFFYGTRRDPLAGTARGLAARLAVLRETREAALGPWHRRMLQLVEEVLNLGGR